MLGVTFAGRMKDPEVGCLKNKLKCIPSQSFLYQYHFYITVRDSVKSERRNVVITISSLGNRYRDLIFVIQLFFMTIFQIQYLEAHTDIKIIRVQ